MGHHKGRSYELDKKSLYGNSYSENDNGYKAYEDYKSTPKSYGSQSESYKNTDFSQSYGRSNDPHASRKDFGSNYGSSNEDYSSTGYRASSKEKYNRRKNYDSPTQYDDRRTRYEYDASPNYGNSNEESYSRRRQPRTRSRPYGGEEGGYSSLEPSYSPVRGEPRGPYSPETWARWEGEGRGSSGSRGRSPSKRRSPSGSRGGWRGSSGPSGGGDSATTMTTSHIVHHYKPKEEEKASEGVDDPVSWLPKLPALPKLPWPFNRRMGVDEGEEVFIEDLNGERKRYPDSIQSILATIDTEETTDRLPFLDNEDNYFKSKEFYGGYRDGAFHNFV
jgi:hypothetical protein